MVVGKLTKKKPNTLKQKRKENEKMKKENILFL
jgi:hypothetical protein